MAGNERRSKWYSMGGRRKVEDRRIDDDSDYHGPERRSGHDRRVLIDRRR